MSDRLTKDEMAYVKRFAFPLYLGEGVTMKWINTGLLEMNDNELVLQRDDGSTAVSFVPKAWLKS